MEVITPDALVDALTKFRKRGDEKWIDQNELEEQAKDIVDNYLSDKAGLSEDDMNDILGL